MLAELHTLFSVITCLLLNHRIATYSWDMIWITVDGHDTPVRRAACTRCPWRGYRTSWGRLISGEMKS